MSASVKGCRTPACVWVARRCAQAGASLRDVQRIAGHADLGTTERYVEPSLEAQRRLIALT